MKGRPTRRWSRPLKSAATQRRAVRRTSAEEIKNNKEEDMKVRIERYDESCPPDESGQVCCPHTGTTYIFWETGQRMIFRRDDSDPRTASLIFPTEWYVDLFDTTLYRDAAGYLVQGEGISKLTAHNRMNGAAVSLPLPNEKNILQT